jgi:WD40 repeat protein
VTFAWGLRGAACAFALALAWTMITSWGGRPGPATGADTAGTPGAAWVLGRPGAPVPDQTYCVALDPKGQWLGEGVRDGTVRVWDRRTRAMAYRWPCHADVVTALAFAPDRPALLTTGRDGAVRLWSLGGDAPALTAEASCDDLPAAAAFAPDGRTLAVGTGAAVWLWRVAGHRLLPWDKRPTYGHKVQALAFAPGGAELAAGGAGDNAVRLWRLNGAGAPAVAVGGTPFQVRGLAFSPDGRTLWTAYTLGRVVATDLTGGGCREGQLNGPDCRQVAFAPDGRYVLVAHFDGTARLRQLPGELRGGD